MMILVLMTTFLVIELIIRILRIVLFLGRIVLRIQNPVKDLQWSIFQKWLLVYHKKIHFFRIDDI